MSSAEHRCTPRELALLAGLTPHTRAHVLYLLGKHSSLTLTAGRGTPVDRAHLGRCGDAREEEGRSATFVGALPTLQDAARIVWGQRLGGLCRGARLVELERSGQAGQQLRISW